MNQFLKATALTLLLLSRAPLAAVVPPTAPNSVESRTSSSTQNQISSRAFKHSLSGLYSIESFDNDVKQPLNDFTILYSKAHQAQYELESLCKSTALLTDTQAFFSGVKSEQRAKQKVALELNNDASRITDLARATIIADDIESLMGAYESLANNTNLVKVKNRFKKPNASGYRDLNLVVELPKTGLLAEVQLHLRDIADVKSGPEHDIYKEIQAIERNAQDRALNDLETHKIAQLRQHAKRLYANAWQPYIAPNSTAA
ncbi:phosphoribosylglycinamide formyltransferase [Vibrio sp. SCSIO 43136]|uniref:phosphoribosylglycinamide formyltransferase n=1 Tax=Vibrio sp. SCSIO 43136 TaxID=2819101 RepID=UPI002074CE0D|nr:phosphoribosylglycinamide formyltransferase [Vibrio sp. SCSIO 43136]USD66505.1 phosphoribosylglycinamide formyltransferase [Vibrio sp. SCSIO 43136]